MELTDINQIVAVGSVDGVLTAAALLRLIGNADVPLVFTQAHQVDQIDPVTWEPSRKVAFVDLAVNNRSHRMTANFVARIRAAGHTIVAVIDEHDREAWFRALGSFRGLLINPLSQAEERFGSSAAVLRNILELWGGTIVDGHLDQLLLAGDAADQMDFSTYFGAMVNAATKSNMGDNRRREECARWFAFNSQPNELIARWISEYVEIDRGTAWVATRRQHLGNGIVRADCTNHRVDMTALMHQLYNCGGHVVIILGVSFNSQTGQKELQVTFSTRDRLDLLSCLQQAGLSTRGVSNRASVDPSDEQVAIEAVRQLLRR